MITSLGHTRVAIFSMMALSWLLVFNSCKQGKTQLRHYLKDMMSSDIVLPAEMIRIHGGKLDTVTVQQRKANRLIVYCGPGECTECRINEISEYEPLFVESLTSAYDFYYVFSPEKDKIGEVCDLIRRLGWEFPVYVDHLGQMPLNKIPDDTRFHSFLLDEESHVVFVGNPLENRSVRELFEDHISKSSRAFEEDTYKYKAIFDTQASILPSDVESFLTAMQIPADDLSPDVFVLVSPYSCRECQEDQSEVLSDFISEAPETRITILAASPEDARRVIKPESSEKIAGYVYRHGDRAIYEKLDSELLGSIVYFTLSEGKVSSLYVANRLFPDITLTYLEKIMNIH